MLCISLSIRAQYSVVGKISDTRQIALEGATVYISGHKKGTISDSLGYFKIKNILYDTCTLNISFVGYRDTSIALKFSDQLMNIDIQMHKASYVLKDIVVSATRTPRKIINIPAAVTSISAKEIEIRPINNADDILRSASNVFVNRSWGIFSKNSTVTMRGLNGSARTLILLDGSPLNKLSGGSINWHMLDPEKIERIEIIKGPSSALYGRNAMGGVINIIRKKPPKGTTARLKTYGGTYGTLGEEGEITGNLIQDNKGLYWSVSEFYRKGKGYIYVPLEMIDSTDKELYLSEINASSLIGYKFGDNHTLEVTYDFYDDKRGRGSQVYEEDGGYFKQRTNYTNLNYYNKIGKTDINFNIFHQNELYYTQNEKINNYGEYRLQLTDTRKNDLGSGLYISHHFTKNHIVTAGTDFSYGDVNSLDTYLTSSDVLEYNGKLNYYGFYLQDDITFFRDKLNLISGLRADFSEFYDGHLAVQDPTSRTGFAEDTEENFGENKWNSINPKLALQYNLDKKMNIYLSYGQGFTPPKLDDLCKSGRINKGFKIANPELGPEKLTNYEMGIKFDKIKNFSMQAAAYYSIGKDIHYFVATGDYIDTGDELRPMLKRQNIGKVEIKGAEFSFTGNITHEIYITGSYAYNHSIVLEYEQKDSSNTDITGMYLNEISPHVSFLELGFRNEIINVSANWQFIDKQWVDETNTQLLESYHLINVHISKEFNLQSFSISPYLDVQNILDKIYIDRKGYLSPGRFIIGGLKIKFN